MGRVWIIFFMDLVRSEEPDYKDDSQILGSAFNRVLSTAG
jgi:hypothetical protein